MAGTSTITSENQRAPTVRPSKEFANKDLYPMHDQPNEGGAEEVDDKEDDQKQWTDVAKKIKELETKLAEHFDDDNGNNGQSPPIIKAPTNPTQEEWDIHQTTHTPFAVWCKHCVAARNARENHPKQGRKGRIVSDIENGEGPTKVSLDYMYLHERIGQHRDLQHNPSYLIIVEHKFGRCWAYQVPNKGVNDEAHWIPKRIVQYIENSGLGEARILLKSDQEPSIMCIRKIIHELKPTIVPVNIPVGEFACNGTMENTIRRVQEKIRTLRSHVEKCIGQTKQDQAFIMTWTARWAAGLISKYVPGDDGKTPYERIRREACKVPLIPLGELVMYLPMGTATSSKGVPARRAGVWLGIVERTEGVIIGTRDGVVKCRPLSRLSRDDQWDKEMVLHMRGVPWEPVPGRKGMHTLVDINDDGNDPEKDYGKDVRPANAQDDDAPVELRGSPDKLHISPKAIARCGTTPGCPGCNDVARRGQQSGKIMYHHSQAYRDRIIEHMKYDPEYRRLLEKHGFAMGINDMEGMTREQVQEKKHQIQRTIAEIEQRKRQLQWSAKRDQLNSTMRRILLERMDVAEIYNRPRIAEMAHKMGLRAGWSLDLTTCDEHGRPYDFNCKHMRNAAVRKVLEDKPRLLIGSPMCGPFSAMNNINYARMIEEEKQERLAHGRKHLEFCINLY